MMSDLKERCAGGDQRAVASAQTRPSCEHALPSSKRSRLSGTSPRRESAAPRTPRLRRRRRWRKLHASTRQRQPREPQAPPQPPPPPPPPPPPAMTTTPGSGPRGQPLERTQQTGRRQTAPATVRSTGCATVRVSLAEACCGAGGGSSRVQLVDASCGAAAAAAAARAGVPKLLPSPPPLGQLPRPPPPLTPPPPPPPPPPAWQVAWDEAAENGRWLIQHIEWQVPCRIQHIEWRPLLPSSHCVPRRSVSPACVGLLGMVRRSGAQHTCVVASAAGASDHRGESMAELADPRRQAHLQLSTPAVRAGAHRRSRDLAGVAQLGGGTRGGSPREAHHVRRHAPPSPARAPLGLLPRPLPRVPAHTPSCRLSPTAPRARRARPCSLRCDCDGAVRSSGVGGAIARRGVARLAQVVRDGRRCAGGLARRSRTQVGGVEGDRRGFEAAHWAAAPLASLPL